MLSGSSFINANMEGADLASANMTSCNLSGADLSDADLEDVDFTGATVTMDQLSKAKTLCKAILPDGTICKDTKTCKC
jgi:uncharacterized protein YjbI with pentapeptide repeats